MSHSAPALSALLITQYLIQDLHQGKPVVWDEAAFTEQYSGKVILVASRASVLGSLVKFDFTWFIPAVIKGHTAFMDKGRIGIRGITGIFMSCRMGNMKHHDFRKSDGNHQKNNMLLHDGEKCERIN